MGLQHGQSDRPVFQDLKLRQLYATQFLDSKYKACSLHPIRVWRIVGT